MLTMIIPQNTGAENIFERWEIIFTFARHEKEDNSVFFSSYNSAHNYWGTGAPQSRRQSSGYGFANVCTDGAHREGEG